ncbi:MAG: O-antigen export system ATP-binding protein RfbE [Pseudomonadota bacterium]|jgi:lipopolysaccharide transport system ATP-binding protein
MPKDQTYIRIISGYASGVDALKRAKGLRDLALGRGSKINATIPILHDINFSAEFGDRIAFIGNNGSGKSSLLKVIAGIYPLKSGTVSVKGSIAPIIEMGIGFEPEMTGRDNIKLAMVYNGTIENYSKNLEGEIIDFSELGEKIDWPVKTYSSGMLSRLAFSISTMQDPEILLLDEVFAAGDHHFLNKAMKRMKDKFFKSHISILVSHQDELIREICNRCILLENGRIIADGKPDKILARYEAEL